MNLVDLAGFTGAAVVLTAFALANVRSVRVPARLLAAMNLGAGLLAVNGAAHQAWPSTLLNATWFVIAAAALCRLPRSTPAVAPPPR